MPFFVYFWRWVRRSHCHRNLNVGDFSKSSKTVSEPQDWISSNTSPQTRCSEFGSSNSKHWAQILELHSLKIFCDDIGILIGSWRFAQADLLRKVTIASNEIDTSSQYVCSVDWCLHSKLLQLLQRYHCIVQCALGFRGLAYQYEVGQGRLHLYNRVRQK